MTESILNRNSYRQLLDSFESYEEYKMSMQTVSGKKGEARFRSLALSFHSTLQRLPALKQELDAMLQSSENLDYAALLAWVEPPLEKAANLLLEMDMLPSELRNHQEVQDFAHALTVTLTVRTVEPLSKKFHDLVREIPQRITQATEIMNFLDFVFIPSGNFMMGYFKNYLVTIPADFYLGKYLVTQSQWKAIMGNNPSFFLGDNLPVENVSWLDVQIFIERLNKLTRAKYYLPTEAEWEYACHESEFRQGINCNKIIGRTTPVGIHHPTARGLYDTLGNVWEWTDSIYTDKYTGMEQQHSSKDDSYSRRVLRGGSWMDIPPFTECQFRGCDDYDTRYCNIGFRLARYI